MLVSPSQNERATKADDCHFIPSLPHLSTQTATLTLMSTFNLLTLTIVQVMVICIMFFQGAGIQPCGAKPMTCEPILRSARLSTTEYHLDPSIGQMKNPMTFHMHLSAVLW